MPETDRSARCRKHAFFFCPDTDVRFLAAAAFPSQGRTRRRHDGTDGKSRFARRARKGSKANGSIGEFQENYMNFQDVILKSEAKRS